MQIVTGNDTIEKKENLPVYKIRSLKKGRDIRVVHRNLLMKCEELPEDVFDEERKQVSKPKPKVAKGKAVSSSNSVKEKRVAFEQDVEQEDDSEDDIVVAFYPDNAVFEGEEGVGTETPEGALESDLDGTLPDEHEAEGNDSGEQDNQDEDGEPQIQQSDPDSDSGDSSSSEEGIQRRVLTRERRPRMIFSYPEIGGDPELIPFSSEE